MGEKKPVENKPAEHKKPETSAPAPKGNVNSKIGCQANGCKSNPKRFEFCEEHFNQFKFGLIKKSGEPVSDYEKKFEHYMKWKSAQKVA